MAAGAGRGGVRAAARPLGRARLRLACGGVAHGGDLVGLVALSYTDGTTAGLPAGEHEIGWWLDPAYWGHGYAHEGAEAIVAEAFALGAPSVVARIQPANARSIAVATSLGLVRESETTGRYGEPVVVLRLRRR